MTGEAQHNGIRMIEAMFDAQGVSFSKTVQGIGIYTSPDHQLEILPPRDAAGTILGVRLKINDLDPRKRNLKQKAVLHFLEKELYGVAKRIEDFFETGETDDWFLYDSKILLDPSLRYHETLVLGEAAQKAAASMPAESAEGEIPLEGEIEFEMTPPEPEPPPASEPEPPPVAENTETVLEIDEAAVLEIAEEPDDPETLAGRAVTELETVDAKMLRQSLDMMNLRRSSNIRLALTRLFRNAADEEELIAAVEEEAPKITSQEDKDELEIITRISYGGFLKPVVDLLYREVFGEFPE